MKTNRKIALSLLVTAILCTGTLFAQAGNDDHGYKRGRGFGHGFMFMIMLREELELSDQQYTKLKAITEKYAELRYENRGDRDAMFELREDEIDEIEALLTDDQLQKLEELRSRRPRRCNN